MTNLRGLRGDGWWQGIPGLKPSYCTPRLSRCLKAPLPRLKLGGFHLAEGLARSEKKIV